MKLITKNKITGILIIICSALLLPFQDRAQGTVIEFEKPSHDFGKIKEEEGPVVYEFKFTNKGNVPAVIGNVQASCGCTTPEWSREPVQSGKSGYIKAQFNPRNRPGVFDKSLTVTANTEPGTITLRIHGIVTPKSKYPEYTDTIGNLRVQSRSLNFSSITTKEPVTKDFKIYNEGPTPISFSNPAQLPKYLKVIIVPAVLQPKSEGTLKITYDAKLKNDFGYVTDALILPTSDSKQPRKILSILANISEYFPELSPEQLASAPKIEFATSSYDFGEIKEGTNVTTEITFTNTGKGDLLVRKAKSSCACIAVNAPKSIVEPGETAKIKITLNTTGKTGKESRTVTVFCNDPSNSTAVFTIRADIIK
jgi:hypothetical protein